MSQQGVAVVAAVRGWSQQRGPLQRGCCHCVSSASPPGSFAEGCRRAPPRSAASGFSGSWPRRRPFHIGDAPGTLFRPSACAAGLLHPSSSSSWARRGLRRAAAPRRRRSRPVPAPGRRVCRPDPAVRRGGSSLDSRNRGAERERTRRERDGGGGACTESPAATLVSPPEGQVLNPAGKPNPLRQKLYIPGYLQGPNEAQRRPPSQARARSVLWPRPNPGPPSSGPIMAASSTGSSGGDCPRPEIRSTRGLARLYFRDPSGGDGAAAIGRSHVLYTDSMTSGAVFPREVCVIGGGVACARP